METKQRLTMSQVAEDCQREGIVAFEEKHTSKDGTFFVRINTDIRDHPQRGSRIYLKVNKDKFIGDTSKLQKIDGAWYMIHNVTRSYDSPMLGVSKDLREALNRVMNRALLSSHDKENFDAIAIQVNMSYIYAFIVVEPATHPVSKTCNTRAFDEAEGLWYVNKWGISDMEVAGWRIKQYSY